MSGVIQSGVTQFRPGRTRRLRRPVPAWAIPVLAAAVLLALIPATGCSKPDFAGGQEPNPSDQRKLPFKSDESKGASGVTGSGAPDSDQSAKHDAQPGAEAPFQNAGVASLPLGTLITVRLEREKDKKIARDGTLEESGFDAFVDEPLVIDGKVAVPEGAPVTGTVESAPAGDENHGPGYISLNLETVTIAGKKLPLRSSSLFARASAGGLRHGTATLVQKGRRLTFRLAEAVSLIPQEGSREASSGIPSGAQSGAPSSTQPRPIRPE